MILVDSSVWIDYLSERRGNTGHELEQLLASDTEIATADIILMEVLQGIRDDAVYQEIRGLLHAFPVFSSGGFEACLKSADLYRTCRKRGLTVRKSLDCLLAVTALENGLTVFHKDRDFDQIARVVPLRVYRPA